MAPPKTEMAKAHISKLANPPLQEVIFELRWELQVDASNQEHDARYSLAVGVFHNLIKDKFPDSEQVVLDSVPISAYPYLPRWRFMSSGKAWPMVQIGPGILSINDTHPNYEWKAFKINIIESLNALVDSYEQLPSGILGSLRYIDVIAIPDDVLDIYTFLEKNFHLKITRSAIIPGKQSDFRFGEWHELEDSTNLQILLSTAVRQHDRQRSLVLQTTVTASHLSTLEDLEKWIENAHAVASELFKNIVNEELYAKFT